MQKTKPVPHELHVVTMISNPRRYATRYRLYQQFRQHMADSGVQLTTVEVAFGEREFELDGDTIVRLRSSHELWIKEAALSVAISRLPADARYIAWIDADIQFARPDWAAETVHMLQHHPIIQPWSIAHDLGPDYTAFRSYESFCAGYQKSLHRYHQRRPKTTRAGGSDTPRYGHSGYAWAARRDAIDQLGGLIDFAIAGSADRHMAMALVGEVQLSHPEDVHPAYAAGLQEWQWRAERHIRRNIGFVPGEIHHYWHGNKARRGYKDRWQILTRHRFDPTAHLKRDHQGLPQLVDRGDDASRGLRDDLMAYFSSRNEDSIDLA